MRNSVQLLRLTETCLVVHGVTIANMVYLAKKCQETIQGSLFNNYLQKATDNNEVVEVVGEIEEEMEEDPVVEPLDVAVYLVVNVDADNFAMAEQMEGQMVVVVEEADKMEDKLEAVVVSKGRGMMIMAILWKITLLKILSPSILMTYLVSNCIKNWNHILKDILGITDASNCDWLQDAKEDPREDSKEQQMEQLEQQMEQQMEQ